MSKRKGCLLATLLFALVFVGFVWKVWKLAAGESQVIASFADDTSGIENAFADFPTEGPIVSHISILRSPRRVLIGRFDTESFESRAKQRYFQVFSRWQADMDMPYRFWVSDESLADQAGLTEMFQRDGDARTQFTKGGEYDHVLEVNITQGTFVYSTVKSEPEAAE